MCGFVGPKCLFEVHDDGGRPCRSIGSKSGWNSSDGELWMLRSLWSYSSRQASVYVVNTMVFFECEVGDLSVEEH
jgi:hypothetical protein